VIPFYRTVLNTLDRLGIRYVVGGESLAGLAEGDLFKYSKNLRIYLFPAASWKKLALSILLLRQTALLKPKWNQGKLFLKVSHHPGLFRKAPYSMRLTPLRSDGEAYHLSIAGNDCRLPVAALSRDKVRETRLGDLKLQVPADLDGFIAAYGETLLSAFYVKHDVSFDSESEQAAVRFLHRTARVLENTDSEFWIEGGTLLGAVRDGKLIPWDHDLDMGLKFESEAQMRRVIRALKKRFYVSVRSFGNNPDTWNLGRCRVLKVFPRRYRFLKGEPCLDIFIYYLGPLEEGGEEVYRYVVWHRNAYHRREFLDRQEKVSFYERDVPTPANPEGFLEVKYGPDWRTPVKEWNVALDDGSIYKPTGIDADGAE